MCTCYLELVEECNSPGFNKSCLKLSERPFRPGRNYMTLKVTKENKKSRKTVCNALRNKDVKVYGHEGQHYMWRIC